MGSTLTKTSPLQKRTDKRISSSFYVKYLSGEITCYGIVMNLSEKGMCISTGSCLASDSRIKLLIPQKAENMEIPVRVKWVTKSCDFYDSMGVELLKPSKKYQQLFNKLKNLD